MIPGAMIADRLTNGAASGVSNVDVAMDALGLGAIGLRAFAAGLKGANAEKWVGWAATGAEVGGQALGIGTQVGEAVSEAAKGNIEAAAGKAGLALLYLAFGAKAYAEAKEARAAQQAAAAQREAPNPFAPKEPPKQKPAEPPSGKSTESGGTESGGFAAQYDRDLNVQRHINEFLHEWKADPILERHIQERM